MSRRYIEYRAGEIRSLIDRLDHLIEQLYDAKEKAPPDKAGQVSLDIYFLNGMRQLVLGLLNHPDSLYAFLQAETQAVEATLLRDPHR